MGLSDGRRRLVRRLHRRKTREREGLVLLEGVRAAEEALGQGARIRFALWTREARAAFGPALSARLDAAGEGEEITEEELRSVSATEAPQGLIVVVDEPRPDPSEPWTGAGARIVILDGVQDPGNVGTLIRVSAAFACTAVVVLDGTADPWSPKALRASAGTAFRIPVVRQAWWEIEARLDEWPGRLFRGDASGRPVHGEAVSPPWALALGGEGAGCRPELRRRADLTVAVPMPGGVESLNVGVAGALLLYDLTRNDSGATAAHKEIPR